MSERFSWLTEVGRLTLNLVHTFWWQAPSKGMEEASFCFLPVCPCSHCQVHSSSSCSCSIHSLVGKPTFWASECRLTSGSSLVLGIENHIEGEILGISGRTSPQKFSWRWNSHLEWVVPFYGLQWRSKQDSPVPAFISLFFLTEDVTWPRASHSCHCDLWPSSNGLYQHTAIQGEHHLPLK